mmetsp:Transcript_89/g.417  ORF Transcript_89/g.417 Transcript_89/m.417 type:complete len:282 (-) Transcript_89:1857-2702(-)
MRLAARHRLRPRAMVRRDELHDRPTVAALPRRMPGAVANPQGGVDRGRAELADAERSRVSPTERRARLDRGQPAVPKVRHAPHQVLHTGVRHRREGVRAHREPHTRRRAQANQRGLVPGFSKQVRRPPRTEERVRARPRTVPRDARVEGRDVRVTRRGRSRRRRTVRDVAIRLFGRGRQVDFLGARPLGRSGDEGLRTHRRASRAGGDDVPGEVQARARGVPVHERRGDDGEVDGGDGSELRRGGSLARRRGAAAGVADDGRSARVEPRVRHRRIHPGRDG